MIQKRIVPFPCFTMHIEHINQVLSVVVGKEREKAILKKKVHRSSSLWRVSGFFTLEMSKFWTGRWSLKRLWHRFLILTAAVFFAREAFAVDETSDKKQGLTRQRKPEQKEPVVRSSALAVKVGM